MSTQTTPMEMIEQHFRVADIASRMNLSERTVRRCFEGRRGVRVLGETEGTKRKRRYRVLLIPASVLEEWQNELTRAS